MANRSVTFNDITYVRLYKTDEQVREELNDMIHPTLKGIKNPTFAQKLADKLWRDMFQTPEEKAYRNECKKERDALLDPLGHETLDYVVETGPMEDFNWL
jgi:aspartate/methionine/tyrosine aminotransferase